MKDNSELKKLLTQSFRFQLILFTLLGAVTGITGVVILLLSIFIPAQPGEEMIVLGLRLTSVFFIFFAFGFPFFIYRRLQKIAYIIQSTPSEITEVKKITIKKNGIPGFGIRLYLKSGKMIGFNVTGPAMQQRIAEKIVEKINNSSA